MTIINKEYADVMIVNYDMGKKDGHKELQARLHELLGITTLLAELKDELMTEIYEAIENSRRQ